MKQAQRCFDVCGAFIVTVVLFAIILNITKTSILDDLVFIGATQQMKVLNKSFFDLKAVKNDGSKLSFSSLQQAKVTIIFNSGSRSSLSSKNMYEINKLNKKYAKKGLQILQFPSNDFNQEPLNDAKIKKWMENNKWCHKNLMAKSHINGENTIEVYQWLRTHSALYNPKTEGASFIPWDYTKFVIDNKGKLLDLIMPNHKLKSIEKLLKKQLSADKSKLETN